MKYDAFELSPVKVDARGFTERCSRDDNPTMWTVYGHLPEGGVESLVDCVDEASAKIVFDMYTTQASVDIAHELEDQWHKIAAMIMHKLKITDFEISLEDLGTLGNGKVVIADTRGGKLVIRLRSIEEAQAMMHGGT